MTMAISGVHLIAGSESCIGTQTFNATNPQTKQSLEPDFSDATPAEINRAVAAAQAAYEETRRYKMPTLLVYGVLSTVIGHHFEMANAGLCVKR